MRGAQHGASAAAIRREEKGVSSQSRHREIMRGSGVKRIATLPLMVQEGS
jgi:hypothetical protein